MSIVQLFYFQVVLIFEFSYLFLKQSDLLFLCGLYCDISIVKFFQFIDLVYIIVFSGSCPVYKIFYFTAQGPLSLFYSDFHFHFDAFVDFLKIF